MEIKEFQEKAVRTLNKNLSKKETLSNMIIGIFGESGEVADIVKKHLYQGHTLDLKHLREELGDVMFYIANLATALKIDMQDVLEENNAKLMARYPEGFSAKRSVGRE